MSAPGSESRSHPPGSALSIDITVFETSPAPIGMDEWLRQREAVLLAEAVDRSRRYMAIPGVYGPFVGPNV